jgi:hypothetical protein
MVTLDRKNRRGLMISSEAHGAATIPLVSEWIKWNNQKVQF